MGQWTVITLIKDNPKAHGVFDTAYETVERDVRCYKKSVTRTEAYIKRGSYGVSGTLADTLSPSAVFCLAVAADYDEEQKLRWEGKLYGVLRTYETDDGGIEITGGRMDEDDDS